jgi:hypothetical protein
MAWRRKRQKDEEVEEETPSSPPSLPLRTIDVMPCSINAQQSSRL